MNEISIDQLWEIVNEMRSDIERLETQVDELTERLDDLESITSSLM